MSKCDFCEKEAVHFGSMACSQACKDHVFESEQIEDRMWERIREDQEWHERMLDEQDKEEC